MLNGVRFGKVYEMTGGTEQVEWQAAKRFAAAKQAQGLEADAVQFYTPPPKGRKMYVRLQNVTRIFTNEEDGALGLKQRLAELRDELVGDLYNRYRMKKADKKFLKRLENHLEYQEKKRKLDTLIAAAEMLNVSDVPPEKRSLL